MIILKKSLMTITILAVAIWVMPAISQDSATGTDLCIDILKKFCYFKNDDMYSDELFKSKFKAIDGNKESFIDGNKESFIYYYFKKEDNQKFLTSKTTEYTNKINKMKNSDISYDNQYVDLIEGIKKKMDKLKREKVFELKKEEEKSQKEKSQKETYLKKLKEEGEKVLEKISHCFKNNESSSDIQEKIDDMKVALMTSNLLICYVIKKEDNYDFGNFGNYYRKDNYDFGKFSEYGQYVGIRGRGGDVENYNFDNDYNYSKDGKNYYIKGYYYIRGRNKRIYVQVYSEDECSIIFLKNFAIKYMQYLRDEFNKTQNTNPMQEFCNKKFDAKNITEFWKDFYFNVKYNYTQLKDMNDLPIK